MVTRWENKTFVYEFDIGFDFKFLISVSIFQVGKM